MAELTVESICSSSLVLVCGLLLEAKCTRCKDQEDLSAEDDDDRTSSFLAISFCISECGFRTLCFRTRERRKGNSLRKNVAEFVSSSSFQYLHTDPVSMTSKTEDKSTAIAKELVEMHDHLDKVLKSVPQDVLKFNKALSEFHHSVAKVSKDIHGRMEAIGIKRIPTVGERFRSELHDSKFEVEDPATEPGVISQVCFSSHLCSSTFQLSFQTLSYVCAVQLVRNGYTLHGQVLRRAVVGVAVPARHADPTFPVAET